MAGETPLRYRYKKAANGKLVRSAQVWAKEEHKIDKNSVDPLAAYICEKLFNEGYETYIVGGAVRDLLLSKTPKDFDIASAAAPSRIRKIFSNARIIGKRFRLVHIYFGDKIFEIATFRSMQEGATGNTFGTIEEDAHRRDFTMNALFYDPRKELVIDFVGGFQDIQKKRVVPLIPMQVIFVEDPVRMLRAVKYAVISGFKLPVFLRRKIKKTAYELKQISASRLTEELSKIVKSPCAEKIIKELEALNLYCYLQPEASKLLKTDKTFYAKYFNSLTHLNERNCTETEKHDDTLSAGLGALVQDYVDIIIDWNKASEADYKTIFLAARKFILPISPPRIELARALRNIFAEHNINVHRWRLFDRF